MTTNSWLLKELCDIDVCLLLITKYFFSSVCNIIYQVIWNKESCFRNPRLCRVLLQLSAFGEDNIAILIQCRIHKLFKVFTFFDSTSFTKLKRRQILTVLTGRKNVFPNSVPSTCKAITEILGRRLPQPLAVIDCCIFRARLSFKIK